jgi:hypothetical protein
MSEIFDAMRQGVFDMTSSKFAKGAKVPPGFFQGMFPGGKGKGMFPDGVVPPFFKSASSSHGFDSEGFADHLFEGHTADDFSGGGGRFEQGDRFERDARRREQAAAHRWSTAVRREEEQEVKERREAVRRAEAVAKACEEQRPCYETWDQKQLQGEVRTTDNHNKRMFITQFVCAFCVSGLGSGAGEKKRLEFERSQLFRKACRSVGA